MESNLTDFWSGAPLAEFGILCSLLAMTVWWRYE